MGKKYKEDTAKALSAVEANKKYQEHLIKEGIKTKKNLQQIQRYEANLAKRKSHGEEGEIVDQQPYYHYDKPYLS